MKFNSTKLVISLFYLGLSTLISTQAFAHIDERQVEADLDTLGEYFEEEFTLANIGSIVEFHNTEEVTYTSPKRQYIKQLDPTEYMGFFLSRDTIEYTIEAVLDQGYSYEIKTEFFLKLLRSIDFSNRRHILYEIIANNTFEKENIADRYLTKRLLRHWTYFLLIHDDRFHLELITQRPSYQVKQEQEIKPYQRALHREFYDQKLNIPVFRDFLRDWKKAFESPESEARTARLEELTSGVKNLKQLLLSDEDFQEPRSNLFFYQVKYQLTSQALENLYARVQALIEEEERLARPAESSPKAKSSKTKKQKPSVQFHPKVRVKTYIKAKRGPIPLETSDLGLDPETLQKEFSNSFGPEATVDLKPPGADPIPLKKAKADLTINQRHLLRYSFDELSTPLIDLWADEKL